MKDAVPTQACPGPGRALQQPRMMNWHRRRQNQENRLQWVAVSFAHPANKPLAGQSLHWGKCKAPHLSCLHHVAPFDNPIVMPGRVQLRVGITCRVAKYGLRSLGSLSSLRVLDLSLKKLHACQLLPLAGLICLESCASVGRLTSSLPRRVHSFRSPVSPSSRCGKHTFAWIAQTSMPLWERCRLLKSARQCPQLPSASARATV